MQQEESKILEHIKEQATINAYKTGLKFFGVFAFIVISIATYNYVFQNKVFYGINFNSSSLSYKNKEELNTFINQYVEKIEEKGLHISYNNQEINILEYKINDKEINVNDLITINKSKFIKDVLETGRKNNLLSNIWTQTKLLINPKTILLTTDINEQLFKGILKSSFDKQSEEPQEAQLKISDNLNVEIIPEIIGKGFDYNETIKRIKESINNNTSNTIFQLSVKEKSPLITVDNSTFAKQHVQTLLDLGEIKIKVLDKEWILSPTIFKDWLYLKIQEEKSLVVVDFNEDKLKDYLYTLSKEIDQEAIEALFEEKEGRVTKFQKEQEGRKIAYQKNIETFKTDLLIQQKKELELIVYKDIPKNKLENLNDYGIKEIVGIGESDFSGSPANRRYNIQTGANTLEGILIPPNTEFSLITTLGEIDAESGYKPELVIKDNRTIAEYGGGLCQIGTTTFRAALGSGLPITERRNHSYRVSYYEPAGTDATIYMSKPDLMFLNDTKNHIMIHTIIDGDNLLFEFWGTKDNRKVTMTDPIVSNQTAPPPTRFVETLDLAPGKKRCTEHAHYGATAMFTYTVVYPNEEIKEVDFKSYYKPWQEVCLIGVEELSIQCNEEEENCICTEEEGKKKCRVVETKPETDPIINKEDILFAT